jgi:hypothetical protein
LIAHPINVLLPTRWAGFGILHDELESLQKQAIIDLGKVLAHDIAIDRVTIVAGGAAARVAAIAAFLGLSSILNLLTGGGGSGGGNPPALIDVVAIKMQLNENTNKLNNLATSTALSFNTLNTTTTNILGYMNNLTRYSF